MALWGGLVVIGEVVRFVGFMVLLVSLGLTAAAERVLGTPTADNERMN